MNDCETFEDGNLPDQEECERRCEEFAAVTGTDSGCAMFFLLDRDWDVQRALTAYCEATGKKAPDGSKETVATPAVGKTRQTPTSPTDDPEPNRIRVMSWNIDGPDTNNLRNRTNGVCKIILQEKPDVVFLQEVVPTSEELLEMFCPEYHLLSAATGGHYCAMMLNTATVTYKQHLRSSLMTRSLLKVKATVKGMDTLLTTAHLESGTRSASERQWQLRAAFRTLTEAPVSCTVIFGGDLDLHDKEMEQLGGPPEGVYDMWEMTGRRHDVRYTWDMTKNDNLEWNLKFRPKARFDRFFIRNSIPKSKLRPVYFGHVGTEKLASCNRYPSDHWGIVAHFEKKGMKY